jgi:ATP-dependent DNA helicase RecQ
VNGTALAGAQGTLLDALRAWRLDQARTQGVPAYVIFHDRTLAEIAQLRPRDLDALGAVAGIGARKLERYGNALLALVAPPGA